MNERIEQAAREIVGEFIEQVDLSEFAKEYLQKLILEKAEWLLSHQWISVDEKLPEEDGDYIVRLVAHEGDKAYYNEISTYSSQAKRWLYVGSLIVTHWMPIPPLLEGGEK